MNSGPIMFLHVIAAALIFSSAIADESCGGGLTTETGVITSPGYPSNYANNLNCTWYITLPSEADRLYINVSHFDVEPHNRCNFDSLTITDVTTNTQLARLCGDGDELLTSESNSVRIEFKTDATLQYGGWILSWQKVSGLSTELPTSTEASACGGNYNTNIGMIESPNYPEPYENNLECVWNIRVAPGNQLTLTSSDFSLEDEENCIYDSLKVIDQTNGTQLEKICGNTALLLRTETNSLKIVFTTDGSVVSKGFTIRWETVRQECGGNYNHETGSLQSPNYPNQYDNDLRCVWEITVPDGQIAINASHFNIEGAQRCIYDSLEVWDAAANTSLGKYCGDEPFTMLTPSNRVRLVFKTDHSETESGFSLSWSTVTEDCGGSYGQNSGTLLSPNYPENYDDDERCTWDITVPADERVLIDVPVFNVEADSTCDYDVLKVYDRLNNDLLGSYCGSQPFSLLANTNAVRVKFITDESVTRSGFALKWSELKNECGGNYTQREGRITSPNYPEEYSNDLNCVWTLSLPTSGAIHITVSNMDLESQDDCNYDSIEIYDASSGTELGEGKYCGTEGFELATMVNSVRVIFKTDATVDGTGFVLNWRESSD